MMPATLTTSHALALAVPVHAAPLSAPLSRTDDGVRYLPSPCQACGGVPMAGWSKVDGVGFLMHDTDEGERCPVAVPFDWETGKPLPALVLGEIAA